MLYQVRDETFIKVKGKSTDFYQAIDKHEKTLDFMLSEHRDKAAATAFLIRAVGCNDLPDRVAIKDDSMPPNFARLL